MQRDEVLRRLSSNREELAQRGVKSLALFGSVARGETTEASDVDLLVEFDRPVGLFELAELNDHLQEVLGAQRVDLILRRAVLDELKDDIFAEAIDALQTA